MEQYINLAEGLGRIRGNKKLYVMMLGMFLNGKEADALEKNLERGDITAAHESVHAIKGVTGNLSFTALFAISSALMDSFKVGKRDETMIEDFRETFKKTVEYATTLKGELEAELGI